LKNTKPVRGKLGKQGEYMPGLEKQIHSARFNKDLLHWEETSFIIRRPAGRPHFVKIEFEGYESKADYNAGAQSLDTARIVVLLDEPDGGDQFTSLRPAINARVVDVLDDGLKLGKLTAQFDQAVEK
jgi:hypothetical protein